MTIAPPSDTESRTPLHRADGCWEPDGCEVWTWDSCPWKGRGVEEGMDDGEDVAQRLAASGGRDAD